MEMPETITDAQVKPPLHPIRKALLRGMAVLFPPLFTIIIFAWIVSTTDVYVLEPVKGGVRWALVKMNNDTKRPEDFPADELSSRNVNPRLESTEYQRLEHLTYVTYVPKEVYDMVMANPGDELLVPRGDAFYRRYVEIRWLGPLTVIPLFLAVFIILLYLLGKFMAAGIGRLFVRSFEQFVERLPLVRNVYSSVKQVSDFLFTEREIVEYTRVVAVEYPRKGIFSLGLVTGESMLDIRSAANEPVVSVLMATSPMPVTGFTVTVRKSQTIELDITIEQAFQFIISCGVVIPSQQLQQMRKIPEEKEEAVEGVVEEEDGG